MKHLCLTIIWSACFLEMSSDDILDPDSALKALEEMAATMQKATPEEKQAFIAACTEEANQLQHSSLNGRSADFIRGLPEALGLVPTEK